MPSVLAHPLVASNTGTQAFESLCRTALFGLACTARAGVWLLQCIGADDVEVLAEVVLKLLKSHPAYDLFLRRGSDRNGTYQCIAVLRPGGPKKLEPLKPRSLIGGLQGRRLDEYGNFGGMELSGVIVTVKTGELLKALEDEHRNDPERFNARILESYSEVCLDSDLSHQLNG